MEHKNKRTDNNEMKTDKTRDTKAVMGVDTNNEINRNVKDNNKNDEIKRDMNAKTNNEMNKDLNKDNKDVKTDIEDISSEELDSFVQKVRYPAKKQEIIDAAKRDGSSDKITYALQMIQEKYYSSADELTREITSVA